MANPTYTPYDYANIFTTYVDENGFAFLNLLNSVNIEGDIDPSLYDYDIANSFYSCYELSNKYYKTPSLWWIILVCNNIQNPFEIKSGQRLKILKSSVVSNVLSQINTTP
jgi:hypothetical protein